MTFTPGHRLGPYEILAPLGAGGMGEVYRARDTRLGRDVDLKVLLEIFARDAERMARFQREAQLLASLNHPNIAILHGLEESESTRALVMEMVEGPTLAQRIADGPIPLDEALPIARQLADALEYAHDCAVIHRDLKPANIKVTPQGNVKVLDFGLAKALDDEPGQSGLPNSPTLSLAATRVGVILGTAAYMSPEQAKGKPADRRSDIWAFGVVLFEMLAGRPVYSSETVPETLASVMKEEPPWEALPAGLPAPIGKLLRRCLDKDSRHRLQAIGEARILLEDPLAASPEPAPRPAAASPQSARRLAALAGALVLAVAALAALAFVHFREAAPAERAVRFSVAAPAKTSVYTFAVSPDGRYLALALEAEGKRQLWLRPLDALEAQPLPGTDDAIIPFWSPDSRHIAFFAQGKLRKIAAAGGPAQTLCDAAAGRAGTWNRDGVILFNPSLTDALQRVSAAGGVPSPASRLEGGLYQRSPAFLPDGRHFFYTTFRAGEQSGIHWASLDSQAGRRVLADRSTTVYVPPAPGERLGHLLFPRETTLMAQPFDPKTMQPDGELFPVAEQVSFYAGLPGIAAVSASDNGVLVFQTGRSSRESQLVWYDRAGKALGQVGPPDRFIEFALSPDERTVAESRSGASSNFDIWLREPSRGVDTRFTHHPSVNQSPVWSPDGRRLAFFSSRSGQLNLYVKETSGSGQDELLLRSPELKIPSDWSPDGRFLLYLSRSAKTGGDLMLLPVDGDRKPVVFLQTEFNETQGQFSSDGRWIAYASDESGRNEIYVRPFPASSGKRKISAGGGQHPRWRRDGKELFYLAPDRKLMAVAVKVAAAGPPAVFEAAAPQALFDTRVPFIPPGFVRHNYAVAADGKRFLISTTGGEGPDAPLTVWLNWLAALKK